MTAQTNSLVSAATSNRRCVEKRHDCVSSSVTKPVDRAAFEEKKTRTEEARTATKECAQWAAQGPHSKPELLIPTDAEHCHYQNANPDGDTHEGILGSHLALATMSQVPAKFDQ